MRVAVLAAMLGISTFFCASAIRAAEDQDSGKTEMKDGDDDENDNDQEEKVAVSDLPKAVTDAAATAQTGGNITEADKENKDGAVVYSLEVRKDGKKFEVKVDATGKVISNKADDEDEDDDNDD